MRLTDIFWGLLIFMLLIVCFPVLVAWGCVEAVKAKRKGN